MKRLLATLLLFLGLSAPAFAQLAYGVTTCGTLPSNLKVLSGLLNYLTIEIGTGNLCTNASGGGGGGGAITAPIGTNSIAASVSVTPATSSVWPISAASLPLPTNASTSALQTTGNTSLAAIATSLPPALGQQNMAGSLSVAIASNQSAVPASQSGTWNITNISGTITLPTGASTSALQTSGNTSLTAIAAGTPASLGQLTMAASQSVAIASNQSAIPTNLSQVNSVALGAPSNYGTSPGAVEVQGVNSFVTNVVATGTFGTNATSGNVLDVQGGIGGIALPSSAQSIIAPYTTTVTTARTANTAIGCTTGTGTTCANGYWEASLTRANGGTATISTLTYYVQSSTTPFVVTAYIFPKLPPTTSCTDNSAFSPTAAEWQLAPIIVNMALAAPAQGGAGTALLTGTVPIYDPITNADGSPAKLVYICPVQSTTATLGATTGLVTGKINLAAQN